MKHILYSVVILFISLLFSDTWIKVKELETGCKILQEQLQPFTEETYKGIEL